VLVLRTICSESIMMLLMRFPRESEMEECQVDECAFRSPVKRELGRLVV